MKIAAALAVICFLSCVSVSARADGNPFAYTITGNFIDGEPNATYTAYGDPPPKTALVQVGAAAVFTVKNTDTRTRHAATSWSVSTFLDLLGNPNHLYPAAGSPQSAGGSDETDLTMGQTKTYSANFSCSGKVTARQFDASYAFFISDGKTGDFLNKGGSMTVTVN